MRNFISPLALVLATSGMVDAAEVHDLHGTSWFSTNETCNIDSIEFGEGTTASVLDYFLEDEDSGTWNQHKNTFLLDYDKWFGGIEGTIVNEKRIEAVETWRDEETHKVRRDPCILQLE